jgi:hypothetical protein
MALRLQRLPALVASRRRPVSDPKPLVVGQPVLIQSAALGERTGIIRRFKWNEDGDNLVVVDLDPKPGTPGTGASLMGWVFDQRQVTPRSAT